jgi:hypothetical protein
MNQQLEQLSGQIERITFTNEDTGFTIAKVAGRYRRTGKS